MEGNGRRKYPIKKDRREGGIKEKNKERKKTKKEKYNRLTLDVRNKYKYITNCC